jgi:EF hand
MLPTPRSSSRGSGSGTTIPATESTTGVPQLWAELTDVCIGPQSTVDSIVWRLAVKHSDTNTAIHRPPLSDGGRSQIHGYPKDVGTRQSIAKFLGNASHDSVPGILDHGPITLIFALPRPRQTERCFRSPQFLLNFAGRASPLGRGWNWHGDTAEAGTARLFLRYKVNLIGTIRSTAKNPMVFNKRIWSVSRFAIFFGSVVVGGCGGRPNAIEIVNVDPAQAAAQAIAANDKDGDGKLSADELRSIPGILKWKQLYDLNSDGYVTADEISQRLEKLRADKVGFRAVSASVKLDGRPLPNVHIVLTPEAYLGEAVKVASGTTNERGFASLMVAADDLPEAIKQRNIKVSGVYPGTYKITVSHPQRKLPSVDVKGLPLGDEIARDTIDTTVEISLSSPR